MNFMSSLKQVERRRQFFKSLEAKSLRSRPLLTQIADDLTSLSGTPTFLFLNALFFFVWIYLNLGLVPGIQVFDPFPFGLLTMFVSLEAIFLSIFVLVSQNRSAKITTLREEMHMKVDLIAEEEITKVLEILVEIRKKLEIHKPDPELDNMLERINTNYIEQSIANQLERANKPVLEQLRKEFPDLLKKPFQMISHNGNNGQTNHLKHTPNE